MYSEVTIKIGHSVGYSSISLIGCVELITKSSVPPHESILMGLVLPGAKNALYSKSTLEIAIVAYNYVLNAVHSKRTLGISVVMYNYVFLPWWEVWLFALC